MQITEIVVHAGRTVNHPLESYSNLKPSISLKATLSIGDDPERSTKDLQALAERLVEDHKNQMIADIRALDFRVRTQREIEQAEREVTRLQDRINAAKIDLNDPQAIDDVEQVSEETMRHDRRY